MVSSFVCAAAGAGSVSPRPSSRASPAVRARTMATSFSDSEIAGGNDSRCRSRSGFRVQERHIIWSGCDGCQTCGATEGSAPRGVRGSGGACDPRTAARPGGCGGGASSRSMPNTADSRSSAMRLPATGRAAGDGAGRGRAEQLGLVDLAQHEEQLGLVVEADADAVEDRGDVLAHAGRVRARAVERHLARLGEQAVLRVASAPRSTSSDSSPRSRPTSEPMRPVQRATTRRQRGASQAARCRWSPGTARCPPRTPRRGPPRSPGPPPSRCARTCARAAGGWRSPRSARGCRTTPCPRTSSRAVRLRCATTTGSACRLRLLAASFASACAPRARFSATET